MKFTALTLGLALALGTASAAQAGGGPAPAAFDAVAVIDDLGPLYYES